MIITGWAFKAPVLVDNYSCIERVVVASELQWGLAIEVQAQLHVHKPAAFVEINDDDLADLGMDFTFVN